MIEAGGRGAPFARGHHFVPRALLDRFVVRRSNAALAARAQRFIYGSTEQSIRLLVERVATQRTEREHARGAARPEAQ
jgi:hypothetical protein